MSVQPTNTLAAAEAAFLKRYPRPADVPPSHAAYLNGWADALHAAGLQTELDLPAVGPRGAE